MKPLFCAVAFTMITLPMLAQSGIEVSIGPSVSNVSLAGVNQAIRPNMVSHTGLEAQVLYHGDLGQNFGFSTGLAYEEKGFRLLESANMNVLNIPFKVGVQANTTLKYISVPLNLKYQFSDGALTAYAFAGPQVGYLVDGFVRTKASALIDFNISKTKLDLTQSIYNRLEIGANIGFGAELKAGPGAIIAQAKWNQGFNRVIDNTIVDLKMRNYGANVNIGYKIYL